MANSNNVSYGIISAGFKQIHAPCDNAVSAVSQGDLLYYDSVAKIVKPLVDAQAAAFCGMALQPSAISSNIDLSSAPTQKALMMGGEGLVAQLKTTAAEVYSYGDDLYVGADAQTVTKVDPGSGVKIGKVILPAGVTSVTGATGVTVPVLLKPAIIL